jgi:hypothetical protein
MPGRWPTSNEPVGAFFAGSMRTDGRRSRRSRRRSIHPAQPDPIGRGLGVLLAFEGDQPQEFLPLASRRQSLVLEGLPARAIGQNPIDRGLGPTGMRRSCC